LLPGSIYDEHYWNAINAPEISEQLYIPYPEPHSYGAYPVAQNSSFYQEIHYHQLIYNRKMRYTLDPRFDTYQFTWEWHDAVRFKTWTPIGETYHRDSSVYPDRERATRVRIVWNDCDASDPSCPEELPPGSYSGPGRIIAYSGYQLMEETPPQADFPGEHILAPEFVIPMGRAPTLSEESWWHDPRGPAGYLFGKNPEGEEFHIYSMSRNALQVTDVRSVQFTDQPSYGTQLTGVSGVMASPSTSERQEAVFLFQPGQFAIADEVVDRGQLPGKLWMGVLSGTAPDEPVSMMTTEERYGSASPVLFDVLMVPLKGDRLFLLGSGYPGGPQTQIWRLDLRTGQWIGPGTLDLPNPLLGMNALHDPVDGKVVLFGGETVGGAVSGAVYSLDPVTLSVSEAGHASTVPSTLPRSEAGMYLDPQSRALYVVGGHTGGVDRFDAWRFSLASRSWEQLAGGQSSGGPGEMRSPLIYHDRVRDLLWVGPRSNASTADGLPVYALAADGTWRSTRSIQLPSTLTWPVDDTFVFGRHRTYHWSAPEAAPLPGKLYLGRVSLDAEGLGVRIESPSGDEIGRSDPSMPAVPDAAFRCLSGQTCGLSVKALAGAGGVRNFTPFILDVLEATPDLQVERRLPGQIEGLLMHGDTLVAAGPAGLWTLEHQSLQPRGNLPHHPVRGISSCGGYLCLASHGPSGIEVVDVSEPAHPRVVDQVASTGPAWDVAARGTRAYVAHGTHGVGEYIVDRLGQASLEHSIACTGDVRAVAMNQKLLAVGRRRGGITLYDVSSGPQEVGSVQAQGQISRIRFVAGQLWVLGKHAQWVEIFDVSTPASPERIGSFTAAAAWHFRALFLGASALTLDRNKVQRYDLVPVAP